MNTRSWGSDVIPEEQWIDPSCEYTYDGYPVENLRIELYNSAGNEVTYPVKGTIRFGTRKKKNMIWSLDGREDVVFNKGHNLIKK